MLRPGWFPEYSPSEQKIFDNFTDTLRKHFSQRNYTHIHTPAVEPVDILSRGWDIFDKQVFGLYGLAQVTQGEEDYKDYALHFDLTIPFARYVLDHMNELTFPFKRYQMQPVRRGERQKRWRYKEFRQFDIDTIWRSESNPWIRYDAESVIVMSKALQEIFANNNIDKNIIVKISNIRLIKSLLSSRNVDDTVSKQVFKILDDRYKRTPEANTTMLHEYLTPDQALFIQQVIEVQNLDMLIEYDGYEELKQIGDYLTSFGVQREFALPIVRWHGYYTGMVAEFFIAEDIELWAIAGGGRYEKLTDFIDSKHSFSGVGISVSNRLMEIILSDAKANIDQSESYFFLNFESTQNDILWLYQRFLSEWKTCEYYPTPAKFGKQLEYADKKWITHAIILWDGEKEQGIYIVKDMKTGEQVKINL
jgi:histidyl-tRNA synthetase